MERHIKTPGSRVALWKSFFMSKVKQKVGFELFLSFLDSIAPTTYIWTYPCMLSHFSHVWLFATLWRTAAQQALLSMEFSRQENWSGLLHLPPGDLPDPGIKPRLCHLLHWQEDYLPLSQQGSPMIPYQLCPCRLKYNVLRFSLAPTSRGRLTQGNLWQRGRRRYQI